MLLSFNLTALEIRKPFIDEIEAIAQLYFHAWHGTYDSFAPQVLSSERSYENCLEKWRNYYHKGDNHFILIALENNNIVGVLFAGPLENKNPKECEDYDSEIDKLYIAPSLKNRGIGTKLLQTAFTKLRSLGFKKVVARSMTRNEDANIFYEKRGAILIAQPIVSFNEKMSIYGFNLSSDEPSS